MIGVVYIKIRKIVHSGNQPRKVVVLRLENAAKTESYGRERGNIAECCDSNTCANSSFPFLCVLPDPLLRRAKVLTAEALSARRYRRASQW